MGRRVFILIALLLGNPCSAQIEVVPGPVSDLGHGSVFCGLYSFVSAATALDCEVDLERVFAGSYPSGFASSHPTTANFSKLDGSVTSIRRTVDLETFYAQCGISDGLVVE